MNGTIAQWLLLIYWLSNLAQCCFRLMLTTNEDDEDANFTQINLQSFSEWLGLYFKIENVSAHNVK